MTIPATIEVGTPFVFVNPPPAGPIVFVDPPAPAPVVIVAPPGPPGLPGGAPLPAKYELLAVSSWSLEHDFPYNPDVQVIVDGERVYVGATYADSTHVSLSFPSPFSGTIVLR